MWTSQEHVFGVSIVSTVSRLGRPIGSKCRTRYKKTCTSLKRSCNILNLQVYLTTHKLNELKPVYMTPYKKVKVCLC